MLSSFKDSQETIFFVNETLTKFQLLHDKFEILQW